MKKRWFCILAALLALCLLAQVGAIAEGEGARKNGAAVKYNVFDKIRVTHVKKPIVTSDSVEFNWKMTIKDIAQDVNAVGLQILNGRMIMGTFEYDVDAGSATSITITKQSKLLHLEEGVEYSYSFYALVSNYGKCWMASGKFTPGGAPAPDPAAIKKITLSQKKAALFAGREGLTLTATLSPEAAIGQEVNWSSSKPAVATVLDGVVTPLAPGKATITCKAATGKAKATCVVTVKPVKVESLGVEPSTLALEVGETATLAASVLPTDATNKTPIFKSSKPKIAKVDKTGLVTAIKAGKAVITVSVQGLGKKVKIPVSVGGEGGETGKPTAVIDKVLVNSKTIYNPNGSVKQVEITATVIGPSGGVVRVRRTAKQTAPAYESYKKYDFDTTESVRVASGAAQVATTLYAVPYAGTGGSTPLVFTLTITGKSGAGSPYTYTVSLPLKAVTLTLQAS